jgi:4-oxalomesaconate tautomerase
VDAGGTSKGAYFLAGDLPADPAARDADPAADHGFARPRQIDGIGGADPLTSKVAVIAPSSRPDADVDYLFLQVFVDQPLVSDAQGCGNILAGVGPVRHRARAGCAAGIRDAGPHPHAEYRRGGDGAIVQTPGRAGQLCRRCAIDGVPGTAAPVALMFENIAGSMCGALLPTGHAVDVIDGSTAR